MNVKTIQKDQLLLNVLKCCNKRNTGKLYKTMFKLVKKQQTPESWSLIVMHTDVIGSPWSYQKSYNTYQRIDVPLGV